MTTSDHHSDVPENANPDSVPPNNDAAAMPEELSGAAFSDESQSSDDGHEESIADYMQQLLSRLQGDDNGAASQSAAVAPAEPATTQNAEPAVEQTPEPAKERMAPAPAPESSDDLETLRELSNGSARQAISTFTQCGVVRAAWLKFSVAIVSIIIAFSMLFRVETSGIWAFAVGVIAFAVATRYTWQFIRLTSNTQISRAT